MTTAQPTNGRRKWLRIAGAITVIVTGGTLWRMVDQGVFSTGKGPAYEPWLSWQGDPAEGAMALLRAAILAANPHNTQPWKFKVSPTRIDLFADTSRSIGAIDPDLREMFVGLGCALENMVLAAAANGFHHTLTLMPDSADQTHVASLVLSPGESRPSELYAAIPQRHTNRGAYDANRPLTAALFTEIQNLGLEFPDVAIRWFTTAEQREKIGHGIIRATEAVITDHKQAADSAHWMRTSWQEIEQKRDGITIDAQGLPLLIRAAAKTLPPFSQAQNDQVWLKNTREMTVPTTHTFGIITVRDNRDKSQRLNGGRLWQRLHLWGTARGLGMQPLNQMSERADRETELGIAPEFGDTLKDLVGDASWQALMPFRIGFPMSAALSSPRRALKDVLK